MKPIFPSRLAICEGARSTPWTALQSHLQCGPMRAVAIEDQRDVSNVPAPTVLIIEDDEDSGVTLGDVLELHGYIVRVVKDGAGGLKALRGSRPDALICDIGLPDMSGYDVIEALRRLPGGKETFAVALTGYARPTDRERAMNAGFDAHCVKPAFLEELLPLLASAAQRQRSRVSG